MSLIDPMKLPHNTKVWPEKEKHLHQKDLIEITTRKTGLPRAFVKKVVSAYITTIHESLWRGHTLHIKRFGTLTPEVYVRPKHYRSPSSPYPPLATYIKFKTSRWLREGLREQYTEEVDWRAKGK